VRVIDWLARTTMLVLASMATLALIGALANVSNSQLAESLPGATVPPGELAPPPPYSTSEAPPAEPVSGVPAGEHGVSAVPQATPIEREQVRWLRALTYAVLALAAFAAVGVVALARIASHLSRIAAR
jgi:disulfide bond formation protein DsbB